MNKFLRQVCFLILVYMSAITLPAFSEAVEQKKPEPSRPVESQAQSPREERVIRFPEDRSLGNLLIQDEGVKRQIQSSFFGTENGTEWKSFGQAKGDVTIPAGMQLALIVSQSGKRDLSPLSELDPNDLYKLAIYRPPPPAPKPNDRIMPHIAHLTGLRILHIDDTVISTKGIKYLRGLKSLEQLSLSMKLTDEELAEIAQIQSLKGLYLGLSRITNAGLAHLANLSLEELTLGQGRMTNAGLAHLAKLPRLRCLMLSGKNFTDAGMVHLKNIPSLRILDAGHLPHLTDAALVHLAQIKTLENLSLHWVEAITDEGIVCLKQLPSLRKLDIKNSKVTDEGLYHLCQIESLEYLDLPDKGISDKGLAYLGELKNLRHLRIARAHYVNPNMDKDYYTDRGVAELAKLQSLEELTIGSIGITDAGLDYIAKLTNIKNLWLFGCSNVTNKGLAKLTVLKSLRNLDVFEANITIAGLSCLNELPNLRELNLHGVKQDYSGLDISGLKSLEKLSIGTPHHGDVIRDQDLACLSKLTQLRWFQIISSVNKPMGISDRGMAYLADLTNMEHLTVGGPSITDEGLRNLVNMKRLDMLNIYGGRLTARGLEYLEQLDSLANLTLIGEHNFSRSSMRRLFFVLPNLIMVRTGSKWPGQMVTRQQVMARQRNYPPSSRRQPSRP